MKKRFLCLFLVSLFVISFDINSVDALKITNSQEDYETGIEGSGYGVDTNSANAAGSPQYITPSQVSEFQNNGYSVVQGNNGNYIAYKSIEQSGSYSDFNLSGNIYTTENGDNAFCLTPGQLFRGGEFTQTNFDASKYSYSNQDAYSKVSWILSQTEYSYADRLTAARAVLAGEGNFNGGDSFGIGDGFSSKYDGAYSELYEMATGSFANLSYNNRSINSNIFIMDVFGSEVVSFKESSSLDGVMGLIQKSSQSNSMNIAPGLSFDNLGITNSSINVTGNSITLPLDPSDPRFAPYADQITVELGRYVDGVWKPLDGTEPMKLSECQKNGCTMKTENLCSGTETLDEYKIKITVPGVTEGGGVQMYVNSSNPEDTQIMMVVPGDKTDPNQGPGDEQEMVEIESSVTINCLKNCEIDDGKSCPNDQMEVSTTSGMSCESKDIFGVGPYDTYEEGYRKDPAMSCIVNACDSEIKNEFKIMQNDTCVVYCRSETEFYMANKTKVYAGMQFEYDLQKNGLSFATEPNLSAVVLQRKQCTSEIFYDRKPQDVSPEYGGGESWLQRYAKATKAMVDAWNKYKEYETLYLWELETPPRESGYEAKVNVSATKKKGPSNCDGGRDGGCGCVSHPGCPSVEDVGGKVYAWNSYNKYIYKKAEQENYESPSGYFPEDVDVLNNIISVTDYSEPYPDEKDGRATENGECSGHRVTPEPDENGDVGEPYCSGSCRNCKTGSGGDPNKVKTMMDQYKKQYISAAQLVQRLIIELQSCSLYEPGEIAVPSFEDVPTVGISSIMGSLDMSINNKVELYVSYDDKNYGQEKKFSISDGPKNESKYYCRNPKDDDERNKEYISPCYDYAKGFNEPIGDLEVEQHVVVKCTNKKDKIECVNEKMSLPVNDYATIVYEQDANYTRKFNYKTKAYTGHVYEGSVSGDNERSLPSYIFPVSNDKESGSTGLYGIDWRFEGIGGIGLFKPTKINDFLYYCSYEVYNTTTLYDCPYLDEDGNINWKECINHCYSNDGGPVPDVCIDKFEPTDSKGYGFIYRNVDLNNLFPTEERVVGNNWSKSTEIINNIKASAERIWTDEYLEYSFTLTPQAINNIRNYNNTKNGIGGYLDNSLYSCDKDNNNAFKNCKSSFLDLYTLDDGLGVKINKYTRALGGNE